MAITINKKIFINENHATYGSLLPPPTTYLVHKIFTSDYQIGANCM